jgi:hypothetical protein
MKGRSKRTSGGMVEKGVKANDASPTEVYAGAGSNVVKEAKERKHGGKVDGAKSKMRMDRAKRKSGGRVGSNMNPLSSAAKGTEPSMHKSMDNY